MQIKGIPINELYVIKDTTPGQMPIWIIIIMLINIYILYLLSSFFLNKKRLERLKECEKIIRKGSLQFKTGHNEKTVFEKTVKKPKETQDMFSKEEEIEDETKQILNDLKVRNRW